MTDDYKERIIKWLTGNYAIEPNSTDPLFYEFAQEQATGIYQSIDTIQGYIQGKDGNGNDLNLGFIYGLDSNNKGVILIVDDNFNVIQTINEYNTGTDFNEWICLNIDITNGNIYGIDKQGSQYRFILLNNFLVKAPNEQYYTIKLRNSYFLNFTQSSFTPQFVEKRPSDAFYVILGNYINNNQDQLYYLPEIATYKIEVGSVNELNEYLTTGEEDLRNGFYFKTYNIEWSGEDYNVRIGGYVEYQLDPRFSVEIYYQEYSFDNNVTTITKTEDIELAFVTDIDFSTFENNSDFIMDNNSTFATIYEHPNLGYSSTTLYKIGNDTYTRLDEMQNEVILNYNKGGGKLYKKNNQIFYFMYLNTDDENNPKYSTKFGCIAYYYENIYLMSKKIENLYLNDVVSNGVLFKISNVYNLYFYNILSLTPVSGTTVNDKLSIKQIFFGNNAYNYSDYQALGSMVPNSAVLYNNNKIIYARNLYNKVVNGNTTTSTVEVPNMMLNDIEITPQELWGQTNGVLVENTSPIIKNIYEDLFINFYNTLTMQNRNTQNYITNLNGATRLNNSISHIEDYSDAKIGKIRVNYSDNTTFIKTISPATQISQFVYQFSFNVYVPSGKTITSIELISNDELTSYQTITNINLESSKSYKITQNVEIGE